MQQDIHPNWLRGVPRPIRLDTREKNKIKIAEKHAQRAAYSKFDYAQKQALDAAAYPNGKPQGISHQDLAIARQRTLTVSDGQVISQMTIYFWKSLFAERYEKTLWKRSLKGVFPNKTYDRALIGHHLETLYQTRNRLAHHEPVYGARLQAIAGTINFFLENLGSRKPSRESSAAKFILPHYERFHGDMAVFQRTFERLKR